MDRTTWLTEERIDAPATGAPHIRRVLGAFLGGGKTYGQPGFTPIASGLGHCAGNGTPLASRGAGFG